ncbi:hypothetical protein HRR83_004017 [Exophiala dermatitidis]|uniref:3-oxoacyl-[acyl-carrier protein] reductase n=2 Tax=Exophiala dermatitidis TaxID=5970 RepID=H6BRY3_EXODN|nr:3-oxoacyl-[acyl-carrier protein] reductase [Exophiala dermatitidis NIH/UT8656]KAJ4507439.1 hypothetical protein HRR73_007660 [Exophiala dermatitidis]EHY54811.1 3-oxoacyl-[acyl-carrier protein] reductase [Exophiala dermatitidis NIH/UT8656]KAJ4517989.1 hypothetical protein HRR75_003210 [Exophiala dermatitidis]KAJ4521682.1 hypothetical protein HRR74_003507 [Exophiala dermatitidis]KAJ4531744.1 hypothetical protein HRR77_009153 [Exophiala dermatitidis]
MAEFKAASMFAVDGWNVVITGGGSGLGRIIGKAFLANGAESVTLIDILPGRLEDAKNEYATIRQQLDLKGDVYIVQGDVGSKHGIDEVVTKVKSLGKGVDTLITAAGIRRLNKKSFTPGQGLAALVESTNSLDWQDLDDSFHINVFSQYYLTAGLLDLLGASAAKHPGRGSVICFSSVASKHTAQFLPAYQASKAAVDHLAKIMAAEFADLYIRVNAISPGLFASNMNPMDPSHPDSNMKFAKEMPARRPGTEQELASAALYLASPAGFYVDGHNLRVDGGRLLVAAGKIEVRD